MVKNGGSLEQKTYEKWETQGHVFCVCYRTLVSAKSTRKYVLTRAWTNTLPRTPSILRTRARTDTLILLHVSTKSSFKSQTSRTGENKTTALMETYVSTNTTNCLLPPFRKPSTFTTKNTRRDTYSFFRAYYWNAFQSQTSFRKHFRKPWIGKALQIHTGIKCIENPKNCISICTDLFQSSMICL